MLLCCSVKNVWQLQAVKSTELHFSLACPPWLNQQMCQLSNFVFFCVCILQAAPKNWAKSNTAPPLVSPIQLVNPYFTENTQPGHTSVNFTVCLESLFTFRYSSAYFPSLFLPCLSPFLWQQLWNIYTRPVSLSHTCPAWVSLALSASLSFASF